MSILGGTNFTSIITNHDAAVADQGNSYVAITPTPGTGIIGFATSTTLAIGELNPDFVLYNPGPLTVYPLYARMHCTVVSTASTNLMFTQFVDVGNRITTTATSLTKSNTNPASTNSSAALISVGANVLSAATSSRKFTAHSWLRSTIDVVHDIYNFSWGSPTVAITGAQVATVQEFTKSFMPIAIPGGYLFGITHWNASQSAAQTLEWEFGYIER